MKIVMSLVVMLSLSLAAVANDVSQLYEEFLRRDSIKLTASQGAALNFLNVIKYPNQGISEIEILEPQTSFVFREKAGPVCLGDMAQGSLLCKTQIGLVSYALAADQNFDPVTSTTPLYKEFLQRQAILISPEMDSALRFMRSLAYPVNGILELDILSPATTFVLRDASGDICFGDTVGLIIRCKNSLGITGVNFQGDSD